MCVTKSLTFFPKGADLKISSALFFLSYTMKNDTTTYLYNIGNILPLHDFSEVVDLLCNVPAPLVYLFNGAVIYYRGYWFASILVWMQDNRHYIALKFPRQRKKFFSHPKMLTSFKDSLTSQFVF